MKPWNASDASSQRPKERWLRSLAQKLGAWLDGLRHSTPRPSNGGAEVTNEVASRSDKRWPGDGTESTPTADRAGMNSLPGWDSLQLPGPPEDWLARVREGAPGLLSRMNDRRSPQLEPEMAPMEDSAVQRDESSSTTADSSETPQWLNSERPIADEPPARSKSTSPQKSNWTRSLVRRFTSAVSSAEGDSDKSPERHLHPVAPTRGAEKPLGITPVERDVMARLTDPTSHGTSVHSPEPHASETDLTLPIKTTPKPDGSSGRVPRESDETARRAHTHAASPSRSRTSAPRLAHANTSDSAPAITEGKQSRGEAVDPVASQTPISFRDDLSVHGAERSLGRPLATSSQARPSQQNSENRPAPFAVVGHTPRPEGTRPKPGPKPFHPALPTNTTVVDSTADDPSPRWPKSQSDDPWPALPDAPTPVSPADWRQSFRHADHLRALDLEQRGGSPWNE